MAGRVATHRSINGVVCLAAIVTSVMLAVPAQAIGPQNVLIITGESNLKSVSIANYYREKRGIPAVNVVRLAHGLTTSAHVDFNVYRTYFLEEVKKHIDRYSLEDRIAVWMTTPDMPHIVQGDNGISGLIYFNKFQSASKDPRSPGTFEDRNKYFDQMRAYGAPSDGQGYLHMRLDAGSLEATKHLIDRSIEADGSFPNGTVYFSEGDGPRASRRDMIAPAMQWLDMMHIKSVRRPGASLTGAKDVIGWQTGIATLNPALNSYLPGALGDHLTSFGGQLEVYRGQTPAIEFLKAGCSATYGTITEPYNYPAKFPVPQLFVFYGMGFTAVESYWQSVLWPQQGVFFGDPLTRPFDVPPKITVNGVSEKHEVKGSFEFDIVGTTDRKDGGVQRIEVYIDRRLVHQRGINELPAGTSVTLKIGDSTISQKAEQETSFGEFVLTFGKAIAKTGLKVASKPGFLILLLPKKPKEGDLSIRSSSDLLAAHLLSDKGANGTGGLVNMKPDAPEEAADDVPFQSSAPPVENKMEWELSGVSGTGDKLILTIREEGKEIAKYEHTVEFPRPASSVCTAVWLDANEKLPKGYRLKSSLTPEKPNQGKLLLVADPSRARLKPTATLNLKRSADSGMSIAGQKADTPKPKEINQPATPLPLSGSLAAIRFGVGPAKLETRPVIDTTTFPDGLHTLEVIAVRGSVTEASSRWSTPIVIRNTESRMIVEPIKTEFSFNTPEREEVAIAKLPAGVTGFVKYFIDDVETAPQDRRDDKLLVLPKFWGPGKHSVTARVFQGPTEVLYSDNEVIFTVNP